MFCIEHVTLLTLQYIQCCIQSNQMDKQMEKVKQHIIGTALVTGAFSAIGFVFLSLCHIAGVQ
jgi:hypothetical protein